MGGMFDKKTEKNKRKQELTLKEQKSRRKRRIITVSVTAIFLLAVITAVLLNSNWLRRTLPAVTIDGVSFTTAEYEYFFNREYMNISSELQSQGWDFMLPDVNRPFSSQIYDFQTGETWADFLEERTLGMMREVTAIYNLAVADNFSMPQESYDELSSEMQMNDIYAQMYGFPTTDLYLQRLFGVAINTEIYQRMQEMVYLAEAYVIHRRDALSYTQEEIDDYYAQNTDTLDIFSYRAFIVYEEDDDNPDGNNDDGAMASAREIAEAYAAAIGSEEDFIASALDYDEIMYAGEDSTLRIVQGMFMDSEGSVENYFSPWLRGSARTAGDVEVIDISSGTAVLYFLSRDDNSYRTAGMRQVLISRESVSPDDYTLGEDDPGYIAALESAADDARERALQVDGLFTQAGRTEQALLDLLEEHSDENTDGGLYEGISKYPYQGAGVYAMKVVPEIEQWLFEEGRTAGDSMLIETEAYGFHLVYFTGYGEVFSRVIAEDQMRTRDNTEWYDSIPLGEPVKRGAFILVNV